MSSIVPQEIIQQKIFWIRGQKVMIDRDLASLYGVQTKVLNQAVRRNIERFPRDFMFQMTKEEFENWKSQIVTSNLIKWACLAHLLQPDIFFLPKPCRMVVPQKRFDFSDGFFRDIGAFFKTANDVIIGFR